MIQQIHISLKFFQNRIFRKILIFRWYQLDNIHVCIAGYGLMLDFDLFILLLHFTHLFFFIYTDVESRYHYNK